jgi:hypothetical protein
MLMIDIETLGLLPGAPIPTIGYCHFDWSGIKDHGTIAIKLENWHAAKADVGTVKFWLRQNKEAIESTFFRPEADQRSWVEALLLLKQVVEHDRALFGEGVWANGPLFDLAHLEYWYGQMSERNPWSHRAPRDCRTFYDIAERYAGWTRQAAEQRLKEKHSSLVQHDAEADAVLQALLVIDANDALRQAAWGPVRSV